MTKLSSLSKCSVALVLCLTSSLSTPFVSHAQENESPQDPLELLLEKADRPTIKETKEVLHLLKDENGVPQRLGTHGAPAPEQILDLLLDHAPQMVAAMEYSFPGATWAFLGRDVLLWADVLDAFYQSIGQDDRVVRIASSTESFSSINHNPWALVEYLQRQGLALGNIRERHPFILVDTVSAGDGRQGRAFLASVYHYYADRGGEPVDLLDRVNMFGLAISSFRGKLNSYEETARILEKQAETYREEPYVDYFTEHRIIHLPNTQNNANEAGYVEKSGSWTGKFSPFTRDGDGNIVSLPSKIESISMRKTVLWYQARIIEAVSKPKFLEQVRKRAHRLGYRFPERRVAPGSELPGIGEKELLLLEIEKNSARLHDTLKTAPVPRETPRDFRKIVELLAPEDARKSNPPTVNASILARALSGILDAATKEFASSGDRPKSLPFPNPPSFSNSSSKNPHPAAVAAALLIEVKEAYQDGRIVEGDLPVVLGPILEASEISQYLVEGFQKFIDQSPEVLALLAREDWTGSEHTSKLRRQLHLVLTPEASSCEAGLLPSGE